MARWILARLEQDERRDAVREHCRAMDDLERQLAGPTYPSPTKTISITPLPDGSIPPTPHPEVETLHRELKEVRAQLARVREERSRLKGRLTRVRERLRGTREALEGANLRLAAVLDEQGLEQCEACSCVLPDAEIAFDASGEVRLCHSCLEHEAAGEEAG